jgi:hypothetical protein
MGVTVIDEGRGDVNKLLGSLKETLHEAAQSKDSKL